jgi:hypothetical protein
MSGRIAAIPELVEAVVTDAAATNIASDIVALKTQADVIQADTTLIVEASALVSNFYSDTRSGVVYAATAAAVATNSFTLPSTNVFAAGDLKGAIAHVLATNEGGTGTGRGQTVRIISFATAVSDVAMIHPSWNTTPTGAVIAIYPGLTGGDFMRGQAYPGFAFLMTDDTNHAPAEGKTVVAQRDIDNTGTFTTCTNSPATEGASGMYSIDLTDVDMDGNVITFKFTGTNCDQRTITIHTSP